jgi:predicted glutamine amidotransferase
MFIWIGGASNMCGIVGAVSYRNGGLNTAESEALFNLAMADVVRGMDGTGVFFRDPDPSAAAYYIRDAVPAPNLMSKHAWIDSIEDKRFCVVHNRAATIGKIDEESTHPFSYGKIIGVHNGTIRTWASIPNSPKSKLDSEAVIEALSHTDSDEKSVAELLCKLEDGAYSLVWYDSDINAIRLARNDDRPMWMGLSSGALWFASEVRMLEYSARRASLQLQESWSNEAHVLVTLPLDGSDMQLYDFNKDVPEKSFGWTGGVGYGSLYDQYRNSHASSMPTRPAHNPLYDYSDDYDEDDDLPFGDGADVDADDVLEGTPHLYIKLNTITVLPTVKTLRTDGRAYIYGAIYDAFGLNMIDEAKKFTTPIPQFLLSEVVKRLGDKSLDPSAWWAPESLARPFCRPKIMSVNPALDCVYGYVMWGNVPLAVHMTVNPSETKQIQELLLDGKTPRLPYVGVDGLLVFPTRQLGLQLSSASVNMGIDTLPLEECLNELVSTKYCRDVAMWGSSHPMRRALREAPEDTDWSDWNSAKEYTDIFSLMAKQ